MNAPIDLRSDTVTKPTPPMRDAMARAEVGDDVYGEDPTVRKLEERAAELTGKQAALYVPSGSMANQIAIGVTTEAGDEVIVGEGAHCFLYEGGAGPKINGVQFQVIGRGGSFTAEDVKAAYKEDNHHYAPTTLVALENTHNRGGGVVFAQAEVEAICEAARERGIARFLDGARLWNAAVASGRSEADLAAPFDLVAVAFSKGLGAPGGSLLAGTKPLITSARRHCRMLGGAMRQNGIFSAAALHGIDHHRSRLAEDHRHARQLAQTLAASAAVQIDLATVQTNIVVFRLAPGPLDAAALVARARERGVLLNAFAARTVRAVTHLDVQAAQVQRAGEILREILG